MQSFKFFIVEENEELRNDLSDSLSGRFSIPVKAFKNANELVNHFNSIEQMSEALELIRDGKGDQAAAKALMEEMTMPKLILFNEDEQHKSTIRWMEDRDNRVDCLVLKKEVNDEQAFGNYTFMHYFQAESDAMEHMYEMIEGLPIWGGFTEDHKYCSIKTELLAKTSPLRADIYIKLSEQKYLKIFSKGDTFTKDDVVKYAEKKKVNYFYLLANGRRVLLSTMNDRLNQLINAKNVKPEVAAQIISATTEAIHAISKTDGMTDEVAMLTNKNIEAMVSGISLDDSLLKLVENFDGSKDKYITNHSMHLSQLACSIAAAMDWHNHATFHKLSVAAIFHDISLAEQKLAILRSKDELEALGDEVSREEKSQYLDHPTISAMLVKQLGTNCPAEADTIIEHHHERPDGSGFPKQMRAVNIPPMSALFIVAHEIISELYTKPRPVELVIRELKPKMCQGGDVS